MNFDFKLPASKNWLLKYVISKTITNYDIK